MKKYRTGLIVLLIGILAFTMTPAGVFAVSGLDETIALEMIGNEEDAREVTADSDSSKEDADEIGDQSESKEEAKADSNKKSRAKNKKSEAKSKKSEKSKKKTRTKDSKKKSSEKKSSKKKSKKKSKKSDSSSGPLAEPGRRTFAEALAQKYKPLRGTFRISKETRFYIISEEPQQKGEGTDVAEDLAETVRLASSQFAAYDLPSKHPLDVIYGAERFCRKGDILIDLTDPDDFQPRVKTVDINETYKLYIEEDNVRITACGTDGIWYGLTALLEIARENSKTLDLPCCRIKDGPDLRERALMLDCGRKYYSKEWIENLIRRASLQRYNAIVLHFAEAEGIRLDSREFPWMTENIDSLSTDEMTEIVELAHSYHMDVIPSFDTPGHNRFMVERYHEYVKENPDFTFEYDGKTYDRSVKGFRSIANHYSHGGDTEKATYIGIDLTKEHAVAFTNALIDSYADFFGELGCSKIDIGSDELLGWYTLELGGDIIGYDNRWKALEHWAEYARDELGIKKGSASDVLISYINDLAERLEKKGYTCRVFNDEIDINSNQHVELRESVEVTYWFDPDNTAGHFAKKGHIVHNFMESWCFYVLREQNGRDIMTNKYKSVNAENIWINWDPRSFARYAGDKMTVPEDKHGGGYFAIWCDHPDYKDAETVWAETEMKTWANASRMWNCEVNSSKSGIKAPLTYSMMKAFAKRMGGYPGYTGDSGESAAIPAAREIKEVTLTRWQMIAERLRPDK